MDAATEARIERFIRGEEIALSTARELMNAMLGELAGARVNLRDTFASAALVHAMTSGDGEQAAIDAFKLADKMLEVRLRVFQQK